MSGQPQTYSGSPLPGWTNQVSPGQQTHTDPDALPPPYLAAEAATQPATEQRRSRTSGDWKRKFQLNALLQGTCGFSCIALGFVAIGLDCEFSDSGFAVWSGIWFIFAGFLGVSSIRNPGNSCVLTMYLIFSCISLGCAILVLSIACVAAAAEERDAKSIPYPVRVSINALLASVAAAEILLAIKGCIESARRTHAVGNSNVVMQRENYYVSHLNTNANGNAPFADNGALSCHSDFHPLQVPGPPLYNTFDSPPPPYQEQGPKSPGQSVDNEHHERPQPKLHGQSMANEHDETPRPKLNEQTMADERPGPKSHEQSTTGEHDKRKDSDKNVP